MELHGLIVGAAAASALLGALSLFFFSKIRARKSLRVSAGILFLSALTTPAFPAFGAFIFSIGVAGGRYGLGARVLSLSGLITGLVFMTAIHPTFMVFIPGYALWLSWSVGDEVLRLFNYRGQEHFGLVREIIGNLCVREVREEVIQVLLHDVRTPLTGIKGSAQAMIAIPDMERETQVEFLRIIDHEVNSLSHLVTKLGHALSSEIPPGMSAEETLKALRESLQR